MEMLDTGYWILNAERRVLDVVSRLLNWFFKPLNHSTNQPLNPLLITAFCLLSSVFWLPPPAVAAQPDPPVPAVTLQDCVKCHKKPTADIADKGMAHRDKVTCRDCHEGHPPAVQEIIPRCNKCHSGQAHFELVGCLRCHVNPHTPLEIELTKDLTVPCLTCHETQEKQRQEHTSIHSILACTACHSQHGYVPSCFRCHAPHSDAMEQTDCRQCHQAHMPLIITYGPDIPPESCAACHEKAYSLLAVSRAKHRQLSCVKCHAAKHKSIPQCRSCHGEPHSASIMAKFPACGNCHGIAHDLTSMRQERQRLK